MRLLWFIAAFIAIYSIDLPIGSQAFLLPITRPTVGYIPNQGVAAKAAEVLALTVSSNRRLLLLRCHRQPDEGHGDDGTNQAAAIGTTTPNDRQRRALFQQGIIAGLGGVATSALASPPTSSFAATSTSAAPPLLVPTPRFTSDLSWPLGKVAFSLLPLAGTSTRRATVEQEIVPDTIWTHDQIQGIVNVNVPVRQTVIRLQQHGTAAAGGGLWVHNPVAPTPQLIQMMRRLEERYGPVRHVVLGSVALEHKATFAAFASYFPKATCWIQPGQWSFPVSVPLELYGLVQRGRRLREIPVPGMPAKNSASTKPWLAAKRASFGEATPASAKSRSPSARSPAR